MQDCIRRLLSLCGGLQDWVVAGVGGCGGGYEFWLMWGGSQQQLWLLERYAATIAGDVFVLGVGSQQQLWQVEQYSDRRAGGDVCWLFF